jgi:SAM-dependent methyltransferase
MVKSWLSTFAKQPNGLDISMTISLIFSKLGTAERIIFLYNRSMRFNFEYYDERYMRQNSIIEIYEPIKNRGRGGFNMDVRKNYYGSLCTEMYEILHEKAPQDELEFYLSYAVPGKKIFEPLCGSGRFLIPFLEKGFDMKGIDLSKEMLDKLKQKVPNADVVQADIETYSPKELFDYIFISSGSVSLFTDMFSCKNILRKAKELLREGGKFVFAVDTIANLCPDDTEYKLAVSVKTKAGDDLLLKCKNFYDEKTQTQFSASIYELYHNNQLIQDEYMDFQTHLYSLGEMENILQDIGFTDIKVYSSFNKEIAQNNQTEMFLYECI